MRYRFLPLLPLAIVLLNNLFLHSWVLGLGALAWYVYMFLSWSRRSLQSHISGALVLLSYLILSNAIVYYAYGTTCITSLAILCISWGLFWIPTATHPIQKAIRFAYKWKRFAEDIHHPFRDANIVLLTISVGFLDTTMLGLLWSRRTLEMMPSPWQAVTIWFFVMFTLSTVLLIYTVAKHKYTPIALALVSIHLFTLYAIAPMLYPLGYGFDAFIHRATEQWIFAHGFILPKQPYYIGQYSLVVFFSRITYLPLFWIDIFLVPLLAACLIPPVVSQSIKRFWPHMQSSWHVVLTLSIAFIPFLSFHLTTPHNLVVLLSLLAIFSTFAYQKDGTSWYIPFLLTLSALITHPLVGAPIFGFFLTAILIKKSSSRVWKKIWLSLSGLGQLVLLPLLFTINNLRTGNGLPEFRNPFTAIPHFLELFSRPYWYLQYAPIKWELVYTWERLIIPFAIILAVGGFLVYKKKTIDIYLYPVTALAIFLSAWLLRSWITFPDVVVYEQGDYPLRLIKASMLFLLPWMLYGIYIFLTTIKKSSVRTLIILFCASALTMSLYFSYPQRNIKARFPGFNITQADFDAVEWIHKHETRFAISPTFIPDPTITIGTIGELQSGDIINEMYQADYIVLANQLVSAAALTKYSFAKSYQTSIGELFYYSIPTGGPLYQQYGKMLYEGQKREFMIAAMDLVHVDTSYFVINTYWANADEIIEGAKKTADSWQNIDDGAVWIFEYHR
ncbi:MAG: hypothetical protein CO029_00120 [Candidatus Magasanikbacteria bacterium CG_4_9_14_0_2_um_filter_41_10]|uniref:Glycosyltransferase RgtA/B/C/D-like domain-containing protein n=1 Tax=Candidatus Magasanikbacteria bacterium CG_4_10_14_0_2_um_filter_41_31 TaxID=1974639 RepID=A0A2M7V4M3_9BACT|nr:MAG: hypothetical protein AUJ37_00560 [Candidatus Magasanikbacteria bacterium CG1_02_41_34]PIZ93516.1 MAG: hypothetical protein COX83_01715 [Candidatus Magasanikbacteria bacterium CG_4_10_14_0_2_um_filter_41_31]PJC53953.1 MAG: hypothetical protein CO029_00120 [Candidatus Magasanikbacteria bacterium CG_4_9_14_0_2_um_filter_41_10]